MKSLKDFITESFFDDEEETYAAVRDEGISILLNDPAGDFMKAIGQANRRDIYRTYKIKYIDKSVYIPRAHTEPRVFMSDFFDKLNLEVDKLYCAGTLRLDVSHSPVRKLTPDVLAKTIYAHPIYVIGNAEGVNFVTEKVDTKDYKAFPYVPSSKNSISFSSYNDITLKDCNIQMGSGYSHISFASDTIPTLINVKCDAKYALIYDCFLFDSKEVHDAITDKWMDTDYVYQYAGNSVKVKNFKKLHAIVNNQKKYGYGHEFPIKPGAKVEDVIPWINDFKELREIRIQNNNVRIIINNCETPLTPTKIDKWWIGIEKRKD